MLKYLSSSGQVCFRMHHVLMTAVDVRETEGEAARLYSERWLITLGIAFCWKIRPLLKVRLTKSFS